VEYTLASELGELFAIARDTRMPFASGERVTVRLAEQGVIVIPGGM
jgi:hypothetical protein